uniref:YEATS domain-containing protein 4-like isoform X2 n=1 Tax=Myxine glutinosa TaxID=7769 RepID=UPI00358EDC67
MSTYVKKIQFKLHESYRNPLRVVTKPPYEITETGWGEFETIINIFFIDPNERPVTVYHLLKLYHNEPNIMLGKKALVSEFYDEMIFQDPTAMMQQLLMMSRQLTLGPHKHETDFGDLEACRAIMSSRLSSVLEMKIFPSGVESLTPAERKKNWSKMPQVYEYPLESSSDRRKSQS